MQNRIAFTALTIAAGCSSPSVRASSRDLPAPPAIGAQIDRVGRPLTGNALIGPLATDGSSDRRKEQYNRAGQAAWPQFAADIQQTLGLYDGFDQHCGTQWRSDPSAAPGQRYRRLAELLADDRLWIDSQAITCRQLMAVEIAALEAETISATPPISPVSPSDCGGRTPTHDAVDVFRSLLASGTTTSLADGIAHDDHAHSVTEFPFLAAP